MAHIHHHTRHLSDSSLLVSCLRHSGVLPATTAAQTRHSSLPASCAVSPVMEDSTMLPEVEHEDCPTITVTAPVTEEGSVIESEFVSRKGRETEYGSNEANGTELSIPSMSRRQSFRSRGPGSQHGRLHKAPHLGPGASFVGLEERGFSNTSASMKSSLPNGPRIFQSHRPFTPPIRPRTSSLTGTQLRSISEGPTTSPNSTLSTPAFNRPGVYRNLSSSSEPALSPTALTSKISTSGHSSHRSLDSKEDLDLRRLYNPRHSIESSLSCLNLSTAEKRTISRGIEQDEAKAEERAEERRKAVNVRRFAGMVRPGSDCPDGEQVAETSLIPGWYRGRKWEYMFNQNDSDEGTWPIRDEPLDPVEVQAMGMLVPLMEMNPNEQGKHDDDTSLTKVLTVKENSGGSEEAGFTRTVKRRTSTVGANATKRPSVLFNIKGASPLPQGSLEAASMQEVSVSSLQKAPQKPKSLRHKISSTLLRYVGHMKPLESTDLGSPTETTSSSATTATVSLLSLPEMNATRKSGSKLWKSNRRRGGSSQNPSTIYPTVGEAKIIHPLNEHYEPASRRRMGPVKQKKNNRAVVNFLLGVMRKQSSKIFVPMEGLPVGTNIILADGEAIWSGYSWESVKFREAGRHVFPRIGDGGLALDRDFATPGKALRKVKKSYASLRPPDGGFSLMPQRANVSWTNFLHEYAGTLGNVRESGVRPISDHCRGSADSLLLHAKTARQSSSLGRSILSKSSECLTTTEMEEYEREDGEYSCLGSTDGSESEDGTEMEPPRIENAEEVESHDNEGEGELGSGYSSNGDAGSSADDDEDSKLRALLHQVGRPYAGYSSGGEVRNYKRSNQEERKHQTTFTAPHHSGKSSFATGNDSRNSRKTLGDLTQNTVNIRDGSFSIQED